MKRIYLGVLFAFLLAIGAQAQNPTPTPPATTPGYVSRVTYFDVLPGKTNEYTTFLRTNQMPILEEQKKQGLIVNYGFFTKPSTEGPGDWDLGLVVTYKNYADAIDFNTDRGAKFDAIALAHYGSAEARTKANDAVNTMRTVVRSYLVRAMTFNPMPKQLIGQRDDRGLGACRGLFRFDASGRYLSRPPASKILTHKPVIPAD